MSNIAQEDEFNEYVTLINKSISVDEKAPLFSLSTKHSSPSSQFNSNSYRLKCFTEFTDSPEINEKACYSKKLNSDFGMSLDKSQEEWVKKIPKESKSYEFTYKILFNVDKVESESNKPQVKTEILQPIGPKPKAINFNSIEKMEVQEEIQQKINQFCLCNLNQSQGVTRNLMIIKPNINFEFLYSTLKKFGEISNIDVCNNPNSITFCFYELNSSYQCAKFFSTQNLNYFADIKFISSLNNSAFLDYIIINEAIKYKNQEFESIFSLFGQIYEIKYLEKCVVMKFSDLRSIKKLQKCLENFKSNQKSQLKYLKNIFLNISEDFIRCILSKVVFPSMDNYADLIISSEDQNSNDDYCNDQEKENVHPNYCSKNTKKPLKLTSTVFSLSEISSVNDANQNSFSSKSQYDSKEFLNSFNISRQNFTIDLDYIRQGMENRTTIMIRNIPNRYSQESLLRVIDVKFKGMYDFIYLPMDFKNKCNIGYAFVNFISTTCILDFYLEFHNKRWDLLRSEKICCVCFARIQGRNQLIKHFKKSNVIHLPLEKNYKPLILPNPLMDSQLLQIHSFD